MPKNFGGSTSVGGKHVVINTNKHSSRRLTSHEESVIRLALDYYFENHKVESGYVAHDLYNEILACEYVTIHHDTNWMEL